MNGNAAAISQVVKDKLGRYSNIKDKLIMQTYDGASVMSGHINVFWLLFVKSILLLILSIVQPID